jgi:SAM-dependent methyltransferase
MEPGPGMRARAEQAARGAQVAVKVVDGRAEALPFSDVTFDTVVAGLVLCTVPDPAQALAEARRVLRPGGTLRFYQHVRGEDPRMPPLVRPHVLGVAARPHPSHPAHRNPSPIRTTTFAGQMTPSFGESRPPRSTPRRCSGWRRWSEPGSPGRATAPKAAGTQGSRGDAWQPRGLSPRLGCRIRLCSLDTLMSGAH